MSNQVSRFNTTPIHTVYETSFNSKNNYSTVQTEHLKLTSVESQSKPSNTMMTKYEDGEFSIKSFPDNTAKVRKNSALLHAPIGRGSMRNHYTQVKYAKLLFFIDKI